MVLHRIWQSPHGRWILYSVCVCALACVYGLLYAQNDWRIRANDPGAEAWSTGYLAIESTDFFGDTRWFRHITQNSPVGIPNLATPQIVDLTVLTRSDEPPRSIQLHSATHTINLPTAAQSWHIHLYVPANTTYIITCDNSDVQSTYTKQLCLSFVDIHGRTALQSPTWTFVLYLLIPMVWILLIGIACHIGDASSFVRYVAISGAFVVALMQITSYATQLQAWRWGIMFGLLGGICTMLWLYAVPQKYRGISAIVVVALLVKLLGWNTPGARFADLSIHITQLENVLIGNLFQQMQGTISHDLIKQNQIQTYPYPPLAYLVIAPFELLFGPLLPQGSLIGIVALMLDAGMVVGIVWLARKLQLAWGGVIIAATTYIALPQSFILQNHTAAAQVIGQLASWCFMLIALYAGANPSIRQRSVLALFALITSVGHFGTLITMSIVQGMHVVIGKLRTAAWIWFGVVISASLLYYSQFITLILGQLKYVTRHTDMSRWGELMMIVKMGVFDHYSAIIFGLSIIALLHPRFRRNQYVWSLWLAAFATFILFTVLRVGLFVSPTRYVIVLSPLIAVGIGSISTGYLKHRAGQILIITLLSYEIITSIDAWTAYKIGHQLVRWIVPQ